MGKSHEDFCAERMGIVDKTFDQKVVCPMDPVSVACSAMLHLLPAFSASSQKKHIVSTRGYS